MHFEKQHANDFQCSCLYQVEMKKKSPSNKHVGGRECSQMKIGYKNK